MTPELCTTCRYFRPLEDDASTGICHHAPPAPSLLDQEEDDSTVAWGVWPLVVATDFCSEWKPVRYSLVTRLRITADRLRRPAQAQAQAKAKARMRT